MIGQFPSCQGDKATGSAGGGQREKSKVIQAREYSVTGVSVE
jgi:hypothetical protein